MKILPAVLCAALAAGALPPQDPESITVRLAAGPARTTVSVSVRGPARVASPDGGRLYRAGDLSVTFAATAGGGLRVDGEEAQGGVALVSPAAGQGFAIGGRSYSGTLRVAAEKDGTLRLDNSLPFAEYVEGVLAAELFPDSPPEALRAQAALARSFALVHLADLTDDPGAHQAYRGRPSPASAAAVAAAVGSTAGLRLVEGSGGPLPNYWYHSTCGGRTADASFVFGVPASGAYSGVPCGKCGASKYATWDCEIPAEDARKALRFGSPVSRIEVGARSVDGRVLTFRATAAGGTVRYVPALQVRLALGANRLRSTMVGTVEPLDGEGGRPRAFRFRGRGWGHGVGLCQVGACALAREGRSAEQILAFYYPGTRLVRAGR